MKNVVCAVRSRIPIPSTATSTGEASTISTAVETTPQMKIGSRNQVIPGARIVIVVTIRFRPSRHIEIPTSAKKQM